MRGRRTDRGAPGPTVLAPLALLALMTALTAGCGDSSRSPEVATARTSDAASVPADAGTDKTRAVVDHYIEQMTRVVACYRKNGLPEIADPDEFGQVLIDTTKASDPSAVDRAIDACEHLQVPMPPEVHALLEQKQARALTDEERRTFREYAECMQENGAPDFPDPKPPRTTVGSA